MISADDDNLKLCMSTMFKKLRGHGPYWQSVKLELKAHIAAFGPPTWFLTLNPDLELWGELFRSYTTIYGIIVDKDNIREYIGKDPVIFSRLFHRRLSHLINDVVYSDNRPIGHVIHHYIRIEYQQRGNFLD